MPTDNRVAVIAIIVSGVVTAGVAIGSQLHDDNRQHAEQVQADRTELRQVLDEAADTLYTAKAFFLTTQRTEHRRLRKSGLAEFSRQLGSIGRRANRVAIRLGRTARAAERMADSFVAARAIGDRLHRLAPLPDAAAPDNALRRVISRYNHTVNSFIDEANGVARSTTD